MTTRLFDTLFREVERRESKVEVPDWGTLKDTDVLEKEVSIWLRLLLKVVDTIGNCQRPVFSLIHKITNL